MGASGLFLADKPRGVTSFDVVARVRRRLGERQVGHGGTLDPMATGLLPVLAGEATRLVPWLMGLDKEYAGTVRLGAATDSYDADGRVTAEADPAAVTEQAVREALARFVGRIAQRPPAFSALKKDGRRLYELARAGEEVEVEAREVEIHEVELVRFALPDVEIRVRCGKGTYIRSIAHDLGCALGVHGHLVALRRTRIGPMSVEEATDPFIGDTPLQLLPPAAAVAHLPPVTLDDDSVRRLRMGQQGVLSALEGDAPVRRILDPAGQLVAIVERRGDRLALARVFR